MPGAIAGAFHAAAPPHQLSPTMTRGGVRSGGFQPPTALTPCILPTLAGYRRLEAAAPKPCCRAPQMPGAVVEAFHGAAPTHQLSPARPRGGVRSGGFQPPTTLTPCILPPLAGYRRLEALTPCILPPLGGYRRLEAAAPKPCCRPTPKQAQGAPAAVLHRFLF